jgi:hypothetical protein
LPLVLYSCTASIFSSSVSGFFRHFFFIENHSVIKTHTTSVLQFTLQKYTTMTKLQCATVKL